MTGHCSARRRQRPATRDDARIALGLAIGDEDDVIAIGLLDRSRRPLTMAIIEHCPCGADDIVTAVRWVIDAATDLDALVVGTSGVPLTPGEELEVWQAMQAQAATAGVWLLEWVVFVGEEAYSVPELHDLLPDW